MPNDNPGQGNVDQPGREATPDETQKLLDEQRRRREADEERQRRRNNN